jgi:hypothetical protein
MLTKTIIDMARVAGVIALVVAAAGILWAGDAVSLAPDRVERLGVEVADAEYQGTKALKMTEKADAAAGERMAVIRDLTFGDGTIEVDLSGAPAAGAAQGARGFVGIAFRVQEDRSRYECFYVRPTNGRAEDQLRRNHSAQYIAHPDFPWHRLRQETPGKYESYVDLVPGEWTKVKIVVSGREARLFVHGVDQPTLIVTDLKLDASEGAIALWIGPGTDAHFANLRVTR